jgi:hypothetical protein
MITVVSNLAFLESEFNDQQEKHSARLLQYTRFHVSVERLKLLLLCSLFMKFIRDKCALKEQVLRPKTQA